MEELTQKDKIEALNTLISNHNRGLYSLGVQAEAAKIVGNKEGETQLTKAIEEQIKVIDIFKSKLEAVKAESQ